MLEETPRRSTKARGPRGLAAALAKATGGTFRRHGFAEAGLLSDWPAIVGPNLAEQTCPERLGRDGTLRVRVAGPLATELQHLAPQIIDRIATYFGHRAVSRLTIVQGPIPRRERPRLRTLRPLDGDEEAALESDLAETADPRLRAALETLGRAVIGSRPRRVARAESSDGPG